MHQSKGKALKMYILYKVQADEVITKGSLRAMIEAKNQLHFYGFTFEYLVIPSNALYSDVFTELYGIKKRRFFK